MCGQYLSHLCPLSFTQGNECSPAPWLAALYFCSYMIVCVFLLVQLVIAVIIENIETQKMVEEMAVSNDQISVGYPFCTAVCCSMK